MLNFPADLWLAIEEIKVKVCYVLPTDPEGSGQIRQGEFLMLTTFREIPKMGTNFIE